MISIGSICSRWGARECARENWHLTVLGRPIPCHRFLFWVYFTDLRLNKRGIGMLWDFVVGFSEMLWDKIKCCGISLDRLVWLVFWNYEFPVKVIWKMLWDLLWDFYPDLDLLFLFMPSPSLLNANRLPPSPYQNVSKQ